MRRIVGAVVIAVAVFRSLPAGAAESSVGTRGDVDRVEAVQPRAWPKRGGMAVAPFGAWAFNDPFVSRGGGGLRALWWPRSLLGVTLEASAWGQRPSDAAKTAQRELHARLRESSSGWSALAGGELSVADAKVAFGPRIVPLELVLRASIGLAGQEGGGAATALGGAVSARWFLERRWGLETAVAWRTATLGRSLDGRTVGARDTLVALELSVPVRWGGRP